MSNIRSVAPLSPSPEELAAERPAMLFWGGMVVVLLVMQIAMSGFAAYLATHSASMDVVPDYYQKALHFDEQKAAQPAAAIEE